jgi:hypothetical protein
MHGAAQLHFEGAYMTSTEMKRQEKGMLVVMTHIQRDQGKEHLSVST